MLLHAVRFRLRQAEEWPRWVSRVALLAAIVALTVFGIYSVGAEIKPSALRNCSFGLVALYAPYVVVVVLQLILLLPGLGAVRGFYHKLATDRAGKGDDAKVEEYVQSYRHLREHGNAFLIILMEVTLAAAMYAAESTILLFNLVVIWILPATFSWFLGTWLEFGFPAPTPPAASESDLETLPLRFGGPFFGSKRIKPPSGRR